MQLVTRAQWGARAPKRITRGNLNAHSTGHWNGPTVKVGGSTGWAHSKCAALVRGIQNFHMDGRGWSDIAYNFVVCQHGYVFEGRGLNVVNGANGTNSGNRSSHAIMWMAGPGNRFTDGEKAGFKACVDYVGRKTSAPNDAIGHRDHKATECPGNERYNWIHAGMPYSASNVVQIVPVSGLPMLTVGSRGDYVTVLQTVLRDKAGQDLVVDGVFDLKTKQAVINIQRFFNLSPSPDGIVGAKTWGAIKYLAAQ